MNKTTITFK